MNKHFRVAGGLAVRLAEAGVNVRELLQTTGLPKDLFEKIRVLVIAVPRQFSK